MAGEPEVEILLGGRDVERIESGLADKEAGHGSRPEIVKTCETDGIILPDPAAHHVLAIFNLGQDRSMEMEVEVETTTADVTVGGGGNSQIHEAANGDVSSAGDAEQQGQLLLRIDTGHHEDGLLGITAGVAPDIGQVSVDEVSRPQVVWKWVFQTLGAQELPESNNAK